MNNIKSKTFFFKENGAVYEAGEGTTRQIIAYDNSIMMVKVNFKKGAIGYQHSHPHTQTSYIACGKFEVTINGNTKILQTGDGFYAEPDTPHGCLCLEDGIIIDVFHPMREDFLENQI